MRKAIYAKTFKNSVWGNREDWPTEVLDILEGAQKISDEITDMEAVIARRIAFRDAVVNAANDEAKRWFQEQAVELITNG